ncbi:single-stranded DNA-binding protein [Pedobacter boryungensis]|uniref:Single-stranded DNA-binding protein n=1 Tax=Pedobacter boryungensis TaxID=869962 RepID=A0ABX2DDX7_9SPHI|nr:single-stranded DNA-binding protein [Pedobacter boryungensis]NQX32296.1 single-stranded DNA-binding protein [Pedobacter boryungensis]
MENVVNKVVLSGCAGSDAEIKVVAGNTKLARVNMAVNERYKNAAGEETKKTHWFSLTFWGAKADIAELKIKKGTYFSIEGRLQNNNYEAKDGTKRYSTEIVVEEVVIKEAEIAG